MFAALLALLWVAGCQSTTGPVTGPNVAPQLREPVNATGIANRIVTSLLVRSPLRNPARVHRVLPDQQTPDPDLDEIWYRLRLKLGSERQIELVEDRARADWVLRGWLVESAGGERTLRLELQPAAGGAAAWDYQQTL